MNNIRRLKLEKINQLRREMNQLDKEIKEENDRNDRRKDIFKNKMDNKVNKCRQLANVLLENNLLRVIIDNDLEKYVPSGPTQREYSKMMEQLKELQNEITKTQKAIIKKKKCCVLFRKCCIFLIQLHGVITTETKIYQLPQVPIPFEELDDEPLKFSMQDLYDALKQLGIKKEKQPAAALTVKKQNESEKKEYPKLPITETFTPYYDSDDEDYYGINQIEQ